MSLRALLPRTETLRSTVDLLAGGLKTREKIDAFRDRRLRALVQHAARHIPFYREHFARAGLDVRDVRGAADLHRLPLVTRADLAGRAAGDLVPPGTSLNGLISHRTSGSTGEPLTIRRAPGEETLLALFRTRQLRRHGMRAGDNLVVIGLFSEQQEGPAGTWRSARHALRRYRTHRINTLREAEDLLEQIHAARADVIGGFPSTLARVAQHLIETGTPPPPVRLVSVGGEVATTLMKKQIAEGFAAPVRQTYGSHEFNMIAAECPATGDMHVIDDNMILEVLREDGAPASPGEQGEAVGTALHSFTMPFLRYRLDDIVVQGEDRCACGAPYRTIRRVTGRMIDYFTLPGGRVVHPYELTVPMLSEDPWMRQYQMTQEATDRIVLRAIAWEKPSGAHLRRIEKSAEEVFGPGVSFRIELVDRLPNEKSGKFRPSRSLVKSEYDSRDA